MGKYNCDKAIGDKIIRRYGIIGTGRYEIDVWEPMTESILSGKGHSSITTIKGVWYGQLRSRPVPADIDKLPAWTDARVKAVQAWRNALEVYEASLIALAFPEPVPMFIER